MTTSTTTQTSKLKSAKLWAYLQMMRPANILTAWADILLGYAASGVALVSFSTPLVPESFVSLGWLLLSTSGLYGGGVVFNDVFDAELDAQERPERPIPSGRSSLTEAIVLGGILLLIGILAASQVSWLSAVLAGFIALAALSYDAIAKHNSFLGPLNMGLCRGANLLLGVSAVPLAVQERWVLALIPIVYIAAITTISRGEVHGGKKSTGFVALAMLGMVIAGMLGLGFLPGGSSGLEALGLEASGSEALGSYDWLSALPFVGLFGVLVVPEFVRAALNPTAEQIRAAVKAGIICLIILDGAIAAGFTNWVYGLAVLGLLPVSKGLARLFAVT